MIKHMLLILSLFLISGYSIAQDDSKLGVEVSEYAKSLGFKTDDPNEKDSIGYTKVMIFLEKGWYEGANYLLKHGYDINIKNNRGETAYDYALRMGSTPEEVKLFKPEGQASLYEKTQSEININQKTEQEVNKLFSSRLIKEHCYAPHNKTILHDDLNNDGFKDLIWIYAIANCEGNQSAVNITIFDGDKNTLYSENSTHTISGSSGIDFKSIKLKDKKIYYTQFYRKPDDPNCCPSGERKKIYSLKNYKSIK